MTDNREKILALAKERQRVLSWFHDAPPGYYQFGTKYGELGVCDIIAEDCIILEEMIALGAVSGQDY